MATKHSKPRQDELKEQIDTLTEALKRERADSINLRRQQEESLANVRLYALTKVVKELLPSIDNLERALKHIPTDLLGNDYVKGVEAVVKQFEQALTSLGVERIKTVGTTNWSRPDWPPRHIAQ